MNLRIALLLSTSLLALGLAQGAQEPFVTFSLRSYGDLEQIITQLVKAVNPRSQADVARQMRQMLGWTDDATLDTNRPWQAMVWYAGAPAPGLTALKIPAKDIAKFKEGLDPQGMLRTQGKIWRQLEGEAGLVVFRETESLSEADLALLDQWGRQPLAAPAQSVRFTLTLADALQTQALGMLATARAVMMQTLSTNKALSAPGVNPQSMADFFGLYFEVIETMVKGLHEVRLGFDLNNDTLAVRNEITAKPGSTFASWLRKPESRIAQNQLNLIDPQAVFTMAGSLGLDPAKRELLDRFVKVGFQFQNIVLEESLANELNQVFQVMFPMHVAASMYVDRGYTISGAYAFPQSNARDVYAKLKLFIRHGLQTMVGKDKLYAAAALEENHHQMDGTGVDRLSMTINTNSPLFAMPGQMEQWLAMWPDGKFEIDYALHQGLLIFASPDRMKEVLSPRPRAPLALPGGTPDDTTTLVGQMNLVNLMKQSFAANPVIPAQMKTNLARLNPEGTAIAFRLDQDNQLTSRASVPMQLFRELGKLAGPPNAQPNP